MSKVSVRERKCSHAIDALLDAVEETRRTVSKQLNSARRALMGQFFTPMPVALFMAGMADARKPVLHVLDPGAGIGSLAAAFVASMCRRTRRPKAIAVTAYEIDPSLIGYLHATLDLCRAASVEAGITFESQVVNEDFLEAAARSLAGDLFTAGIDERFDCAYPRHLDKGSGRDQFAFRSSA